MKAPLLSEVLSPEHLSEAISWRHELHRAPETAFQERLTSDFIASKLEGFGLRVHRGLAGTGVVGSLIRGTASRSIGIRADIDALPIVEASEAPHSSCRRGVMHACGHDGHVAIALAAARACAHLRDLDGTVHFIFQPAEENEGGGKRMVEDGLFRLCPCDQIFALHNWPALPVGTCVVKEGPILSAYGAFEIVVSGQGCHGALPHEGADVVLATGQLITALQSIVSRNVDPRQAGVLSVTYVQAGHTWNTIPGSSTIRGTTRWFEDEVGNTIEQRMKEIALTIAAAFRCEATVRYERRYPPTINDSASAEALRGVAQSVGLSLADIPPSTGSEDFAFMLQAVPGCYLLLGAGDEKHKAALHSPEFDFNDELITWGAQLWTALIRNRLASEPSGVPLD